MLVKGIASEMLIQLLWIYGYDSSLSAIISVFDFAFMVEAPVISTENSALHAIRQVYKLTWVNY